MATKNGRLDGPIETLAAEVESNLLPNVSLIEQ